MEGKWVEIYFNRLFFGVVKSVSKYLLSFIKHTKKSVSTNFILYGNESSKCMFVQIFGGDICFLEFFIFRI